MKKPRKLLAVLTVAAMLLTLAATGAGAQAPGQAFPDVAAGHFAAKALSLLKDLGVYKGYPDGTAQPDNKITRAEFAAVVTRVLGLEKMAESVAALTPTFRDVDPAWAWAYGYVNVLTGLDIVRGYPDGTFRPSADVTFAEAFAMLIRAMGLDGGVKGTWPTNYLIAANTIGLNKGLNVVANLPITRGEMAVSSENALFANFVVDANKNIVASSASSGGDSLIRRVFKWTGTQYDGYVAPAVTVTGTLTQVLAASNRIEVGGKLYAYTVATKTEVNRAESTYTTLSAVGTALDAATFKGQSVTLTLAGDGTVAKVSRTINSPNQLIQAVTVTTGETAYGTVTFAVYGSPTAVNPDVEVRLNGAASNVAALKAAFDDLTAKYGATARAVATVRTVGNAAIGPSNVYYIDAYTQPIVTGKVTSLGSDAGGPFFRADVGGTSNKYYYLTGVSVTVGTTTTFLLNPAGQAVAVLTAPPPTVTAQVFWAHVLAAEYGGTNAGFLVNIDAHTVTGRATYSGAVDANGVPTTAVNATYVKANTVAAVYLSPAGRVTVIWGNTQPSPTFDPGIFTADGTVLHYSAAGTTATFTALVAGLSRFTIESPTESGNPTVEIFAGPDTIILRANGTHSARDLAHLRDNPGKIARIFYSLKDGFRTAQIIQLTVNE